MGFTVNDFTDTDSDRWFGKNDASNPGYEKILNADFSDKETSTCSRQVGFMKRAFTEDPLASNPKIDERYTDLIDFVRNCLMADPKKRFGDFKTAKDHRFLNGVNWDFLLAEDGHKVSAFPGHTARQSGDTVFKLNLAGVE